MHTMRQNIYLFIVFFKELQGYHHSNHAGIYSGLISNFEVVVPKILSHHKVNGVDVVVHHLDKRQISSPDKQRIHIELKLGEKIEVLDLWQSSNFISDDLHIEKIGIRNSSESIRTHTTRHCHYRGTIRGQNSSSVAISTCNGIVGFIRTDKDSYWLEPSMGGRSEERAHLLFKRSAVESIRKGGNNKKKRVDKACGTREYRHFVKRTRWQRRRGAKIKVEGRERRRKKRLLAKKKKHDRRKNDKRSDRTRHKRSTSRKHHVECLVVADSSMVDFHQEEEIETYLLTIMNMVNAMYHDASIGNYINVVVVRIILLGDEVAQGLRVTVNADLTLDSFCHWQRKVNYQLDTHPLHHDVAILITSFGMYHDTKKSGCSGKKRETLHVMTTSFEADIVNVAWSECSRREITNFFDAGHGDCLYDEPTSVVLQKYPDLPIGAVYNAEYQCKIQFAVDNTSVCTPMDEVCNRLWCIVDGACTTMLQPAAPGTNCGKRKWCNHQLCEGIGESVQNGVGGVIDGGWGAWQQWRPCSRSCGGGVSLQQRFCDHPVPSHGGAYCLGERTRYRICNTQECQNSTPSFRAKQCLAFNGKIFNSGVNATWFPHFDTTEPCQLFCTDADESVIMPMGVRVEDGTPCKLGHNDMCIAGVCRKIGCDWKLDSDLVEDRCGNCLSDGAQCTFHENYYNNSYGLGYVKLVTIPKYARNIIVQELGNTLNYIGVASAVTNNFFLNGNKAITLPGEYIIAGSQALYQREKEKEHLYIVGPIRDIITIYLIFRDGHKNLGVHYEYTLPKNVGRASNASRYFWREKDWTTCSVTCGQGEQRLAVACQDSTNQKTVDDELCQLSKKPKITSRPCKMQPCLYRWWTSDWQVCPVTCGNLVQRHRSVICVTSDDVTGNRVAHPDSACAELPKPPISEPCSSLPPCLLPPKSSKRHYSLPRLHFENGLPVAALGWRTMAWSRCSANCGLGFKKRTVFCAKPDLSCKLKSRPIAVKQCLRKCV
ncbi:A disintegrin and metalloproteinase with thrombospondin motifs 7 isoform X3 [Nilaparvata lugens]|uniref:A disintegrin and metalloproteinase with thrombospondin motifs 7 isoform X3 n=1 Tax=Nilaparvata lugens TaxID=108931 RepID=UPI00193E1AD4|nr:A disintegrin and metalloproteinase with thrombospondin motifs 7 isoform X3 [Nilaparvata lugens]